ncbi:MAG: Os1348 family NHLP clan protein [Chloroflexota bacterium]
MSEALDKVVSKAVQDENYRKLLLSNPAAALAGYEVTDEERQLLENLNEATFDKFAGDLGDRDTKGIWTPGAG